MKICKYLTVNYKHDDTFTFKGEEYYVHSIVRLTEKGRDYLGAKRHEVILTEQFTNWNGKLCWKYEFRSANFCTTWPVDYSTDKTPDELIEEVVMPATDDYRSREVLGVYSPVWTKGKKNVPKDWKDPTLIKLWVMFILCFVGAAVFQGALKWLVRIVVCVVCAISRQNHIDTYTTYDHEEDDKIMRKKLDVLYGTKFSEEDTTNE